MKSRTHLRWLFAVQAVLLVVAAWQNLHQLNPDAIAYMRIAGYYAAGQTELAVSGYWGPLLSWMMVPLLKVGAAPMVAARVVMALSGVVFLAGALAVFRAFRLPRLPLLFGAWVAASWSVFWSVRNITPDLLMAGLVGLAVGGTMKLFLRSSRRGGEADSSNSKFRIANSEFRIRLLSSAATAGGWWGLAYLAKAVALPLALVVSAALAVLALSGRRELRAAVGGRLGLVWLCTAIVAGPWIGVLTLHYGKFTFSTTGPIAHALAGPGPKAGSHPAMTTLHQPDAGRMTQWEEPSRMAYEWWSPLASEENFRHQLGGIAGNIGVCWDWLSPWSAWVNGTGLPAWRRWLGAFDLFGISGLAVLVAAACVVRNSNRLRRVRWAWAAVPVVVLGGLYLPFFVMAEDNRYFYPVWPWLWLMAWAGLAVMPRGELRGFGAKMIGVSFAIPSMVWCGAALNGLPNPASASALQLSSQLQADRVAGPFAGSAALPGGRTGLYTAFLLGGRWLGDAPQAGPEEFSKAGAQVVFVRRGAPAVALFVGDSEWREWREAVEKSSFIGEVMSGRLFVAESEGAAVRVFVRKTQ